MGHQAQSQKLRSKRPDGRPVAAKTRAKIEAKSASKATIQELRVTSKQKEERKVRETAAAVNGDFAKKSKSSDEKLMHALRKKLRQVEDLIKKQNAGATLDEAQLEKVASLEELIAQLEETATRQAQRGTGR